MAGYRTPAELPVPSTRTPLQAPWVPPQEAPGADGNGCLAVAAAIGSGGDGRGGVGGVGWDGVGEALSLTLFSSSLSSSSPGIASSSRRPGISSSSSSSTVAATASRCPAERTRRASERQNTHVPGRWHGPQATAAEAEACSCSRGPAWRVGSRSQVSHGTGHTARCNAWAAQTYQPYMTSTPELPPPPAAAAAILRSLCGHANAHSLSPLSLDARPDSGPGPTRSTGRHAPPLPSLASRLHLPTYTGARIGSRRPAAGLLLLLPDGARPQLHAAYAHIGVRGAGPGGRRRRRLRRSRRLTTAVVHKACPVRRGAGGGSKAGGGCVGVWAMHACCRAVHALNAWGHAHMLACMG